MCIKKIMAFLALGFISYSGSVVLAGLSIDNFAYTSESYAYNINMNNIVKSTFGDDYRLADWRDILTYYNEGNDMQALTEFIGSTRMWVSYYGTEFYASDRHYFVNVSNHSTPSGFLVHAHIDNHLIDLGSWWDSRPILAYTDNPIPEPATLSLLALGAILAGRKRRVYMSKK